MKSDTPRTDAVVAQYPYYAPEVVELCRQLESVLRKSRMYIANNGSFRSKESMLREIESVMAL